MVLVNNSKRVARGSIYSGFPHTNENRIAGFGDVGEGGSVSREVNPGDYYVVLATTNIGPLPPGLIIATSGGVPSEGAITLTENDRISIR